MKDFDGKNFNVEILYVVFIPKVSLIQVLILQLIFIISEWQKRLSKYF